MTPPPAIDAPLDLLVDGQGVQGEGRRRGVGRYARELVAAIARVRPHWRVRLAAAAHLGELDAPPGVEVVHYTPPAPVSFCDGPTTDLLRLHYADWLASHRPDGVLVLSPFEAGGVPILPVGGPPTVAVFYDLIPLLFADQYLFRQPMIWAFYARQLRQCLAGAGLLAISDATRADLVGVLGAAAAANIRGAVASDFPMHAPGDARRLVAALFARTGVPDVAAKGYLLYVGGGDFRKNLPALFAALALLPRGVRAAHPLVVAGELPAATADLLRAAAARHGVGDEVVFLGYMSDAELAALYQSTRLFVFPSLCEGLGLPVLEALACGADVAAAGTSSVPEFSGPGTAYFDPADPLSIAHVVYAALTRPGPTDPAAKRAFAAGFTWDATAEAACRAIQAAVRGHGSKHDPRRVVWRRRFSPDTTGDDICLFAGVLSSPRCADVTLLKLPGDAPVPAAVARRVRVRTPAEVAKAEELTPTAVHVTELDSPADLESAGAWPLRRPGLLVVSDRLARSDVWADPRFSAGRRAADRVLVRGPATGGDPLPERFRGDGRVVRGDAAFPRALCEAEHIGRTADRRWRNAAVAALLAAPLMPDAFLTEWAALRAAGGERTALS